MLHRERQAVRPTALRASDVAIDVPLEKYTVFGNTFLFVDETCSPMADDGDRAAFARWALDEYFGVGGADNVIYLDESGGLHRFRIFEHDGAETLSCGNGLLSTAAVLARRTGGAEWTILTELPTGRPRPVRVGLAADGSAWAALGRPRAVPGELFRRKREVPPGPLETITVEAVPPVSPEWTRRLPPRLVLTGSLVFTGEPHLVLVVGHGVDPRLGDLIFSADPDTHPAGDRLVHHIGGYVNARYRDTFPYGVHLDFVSVEDEDGVLRYRTWERAIDKETLACGTGALACAYTAQRHGLVRQGVTRLRPARCLRRRPDAALEVAVSAGAMVLRGRPMRVYAGSVPWSGGLHKARLVGE